MDAQQFLAEFGHIASAPEGINRLRELILQLAISGKLVEASTDKNTIDNVLALASRLRSEYETKFELRAIRPHPPINSAPYPIPSHWQWERLEQISLYIQRGKGPIYADKSNIFVVSQKCVQWSGFDLSPARYVSEDSLKAYGKERFLKDGDLLWNSTGTGTAGRISIYDQSEEIHAVADSHVTVIRLANFLPRYIWCVIASPWVQLRIIPGHVESLVSGTTQQVELATNTARALPIPCPPIEEQARIVAKVVELMSLCDKLEAQQQELNKLEVTSCKAVLGDLTNVDTISFSSAWERLDQNIGSFFRTPEAIDDFETSLNTLAVRGLLTPATSIKPDVDAIIRACTELQDKYIAAKWMRKQKMVLASDSAVEYPSNWEVVTFDEVGVVIGGVTKGRNLKGREVVTCPYLSVANVQRGFFTLERIKTIEIAVEEFGKYRVEDGDLMITEGGDWDKVGRTAIWHGSIENCLHQNHVFKARVPSDQLLNEWVELVFNSNVGRDYFARASKQTTNLASINMTQLRSFSLPIPPLVEQKAILEKLAAMTKTCNTWRGQREEAKKLSSLLAAACVSTITGVRSEEEEILKVPKTELISKLRLGKSPTIKEQAPLAAILTRQNGEMAAKDLWQRFGGEIDAFYAQLKLEVSKGWILEPDVAAMRVI